MIENDHVISPSSDVRPGVPYKDAAGCSRAASMSLAVSAASSGLRALIVITTVGPAGAAKRRKRRELLDVSKPMIS